MSSAFHPFEYLQQSLPPFPFLLLGPSEHFLVLEEPCINRPFLFVPPPSSQPSHFTEDEAPKAMASLEGSSSLACNFKLCCELVPPFRLLNVQYCQYEWQSAPNGSLGWCNQATQIEAIQIHLHALAARMGNSRLHTQHLPCRVLPCIRYL